jgi:hypothetical protein
MQQRSQVLGFVDDEAVEDDGGVRGLVPIYYRPQHVVVAAPAVVVTRAHGVERVHLGGFKV